MTDRPPFAAPPEDHDDALAAEYVLGTLPLAERRAARERAETDGAFAARVAAWEARLAGLNDAYTDEPPTPGLYDAIETRLFPAPPAATRPARWRLWLSAGALAAAVAAGVAVLGPVLPLFGPQAPAPLTAELAAEGVVWLASYDGASLTITRQGAAAGAEADYQLWAIADDGVPRSLGLLRDEQVVVASDLVTAGITLAVSLEPLGGAPGVLPTGPVLAAAPLAAG